MRLAEEIHLLRFPKLQEQRVMDMQEVMDWFTREHWTVDSGITTLRVDPEDPNCLMVGVQDEATAARIRGISIPYQGVTLKVIVHGRLEPLQESISA